MEIEPFVAVVAGLVAAQCMEVPAYTQRAVGLGVHQDIFAESGSILRAPGGSGGWWVGWAMACWPWGSCCCTRHSSRPSAMTIWPGGVRSPAWSRSAACRSDDFASKICACELFLRIFEST